MRPRDETLHGRIKNLLVIETVQHWNAKLHQGVSFGDDMRLLQKQGYLPGRGSLESDGLVNSVGRRLCGHFG